MPKIEIESAKTRSGKDETYGPYDQRLLGEAGGVTQFGAIVETLYPGAKSSNRHWHEREDEFAYILDDGLILVEDAGEVALAPGDAVAWKAGVPNAHHLINRSDRPARFFVIGTRAQNDVVHYPDTQTRRTRADGQSVLTDLDGNPVEED